VATIFARLIVLWYSVFSAPQEGAIGISG